MVAKKIVVDGFAAAKALFCAVPEADAILAELPAQAYFAAVIKTQKIDEADVQVLDQGAGLLHLIHGFFERGGAGVAAGSEGEIRSTVDAGSAGSSDMLHGTGEFVLGFPILCLVEQGVAKGALHLGQQTLAFGHGKVAGHDLN